MAASDDPVIARMRCRSRSHAPAPALVRSLQRGNAALGAPASRADDATLERCQPESQRSSLTFVLFVMKSFDDKNGSVLLADQPTLTEA